MSSATALGLPELEKRLTIAKQAAFAAGELHKKYYQTALRIETKSSGIDLVTEVDRDCDQLIQDTLRHLCQLNQLSLGHMLTEESYEHGVTSLDLDQAWVVDPLDGTTNYAHTFPHFAVSIAYLVNGQPQLGVIYDALKHECYTAIKGQGARLNDQPLRVSRPLALSEALLATGFPYDHQTTAVSNMQYFQTFMDHCHGVRRTGSAAMDLAYMAGGRLDGFWEMRLAPWDVAAGALIVEEAGGIVSTLDGQPLTLSQRYINIVGGNSPALHQQIVDLCQAVATGRVEPKQPAATV